MQFTASTELYAKIERAKQLLSHSVRGADLAGLMERAIDALIEKEIQRKRGVGKKRKRRPQKPGSREVAVEVANDARSRLTSTSRPCTRATVPRPLAWRCAPGD